MDHHAFVVPAYGQSPFLDDCLRSLSAQTTPSKIIIATSTPSSFLEAAAERAGAELVVNPRRENIAADWNFALGCAGAQLVTLAHQDDVYFPKFLEETLALFDRWPDGAIAFTGYEEIDDHGRPSRSKISVAKHALDGIFLGESKRPGPARMRAFLSVGCALPCSSVTYNLERLVGFSFSADYAAVVDWDAWIRLNATGAIFVRSPGRLIGRRHNPLTETSRLIADGTRRREDLAMFERMWPRALARAIAWAYRAGY